MWKGCKKSLFCYYPKVLPAAERPAFYPSEGCRSCLLPTPMFLSPIPFFKDMCPLSPPVGTDWLSWLFKAAFLFRDFSFLPIICRSQVPYFLDRLHPMDPAFLGLFSLCRDSRLFPSTSILSFGLNGPKREALEEQLVGCPNKTLGNAFRIAGSPICSMFTEILWHF